MLSLPRSSSMRVALFFCLLCLIPASFAKQTLPCASDPFADPKHDPCNPLEYIPSNSLTAIALIVFLLIAIADLIQMWVYGARWMAALVVGLLTFCIGFGFRFGLHTHPDSKGTFIGEYLFIVLSPCAFIAADYVLLGRLATHLDAAHHLFISPRRITPLFVASDVSTFIIQAIGGIISSSSNTKKANDLGSHIFLIGLVLQLVSFILFSLLYIQFLYLVYTRSPEKKYKDAHKPWYSDWRALAFALLLSCGGIMVRSVYRTIELIQGFRGPLATSEGAFYGLDTFPLLIAVSAFVFFWPGRFMQEKRLPADLAVPLGDMTRRP